MGELTAFRDGVWLSTAPVSFLGLKLTTTMSVLQLDDGGLLLYSPTPLTSVRQAEVDELGVVEHIYAPSLFHHLSVSEWANAYPDARVHGPAGLPKKHKGLALDRANNDGEGGSRGVAPALVRAAYEFLPGGRDV